MSKDTGLKYDGDKPPVELVPRQLIEGAARAFGYCEKKYAAYNWREGIRTRRLMGGILRHVIAFSSGERTDSESGLSHLDLAAAGLAMLMATIDESLADDDLLKLEKAEDVKSDGRKPGYYLRDSATIHRLRSERHKLKGLNEVHPSTIDRAIKDMDRSIKNMKLPAYAAQAPLVGDPEFLACYYEEVK